MLQASSERAAAARLWVPGMIPGPMDAVSARAQEIARRREEMLGMLHDLPESEYELSLTDLVEKAGGEEAAAPPAEGRDPAAARSASGRPERRASARRRTDSGSTGGSSFRSSSDGVLLNFYTPRSLTRSFTAPRPSRTPSFAGGRTPSVASECYKRYVIDRSSHPQTFREQAIISTAHSQLVIELDPSGCFQNSMKDKFIYLFF
jgi:hypothetical protein